MRHSASMSYWCSCTTHKNNNINTFVFCHGLISCLLVYIFHISLNNSLWHSEENFVRDIWAISYYIEIENRLSKIPFRSSKGQWVFNKASYRIKPPRMTIMSLYALCADQSTVANKPSVAVCTFYTSNTLRPRQDGRHFADDIFTCIFFNENSCILIRISLKYVRKGLIDNNPTLVQIMAWRRSGDKPLSEPLMIISSTHICVARPQWVNRPITKRPLNGLYIIDKCSI